MNIQVPSYQVRIQRYQRGIRRYQALYQKLDTVSGKIALIRFISFVIAAACTFSAWYDRAWTLYLPWAGVAWICFGVALWYHRRLYALVPRVKVALNYYQQALVRVKQEWSSISDDGMRFHTPSHPHEREMLLFGDMSAYKALNSCYLAGSQARLAFLLKGGLFYQKEKSTQQQQQEQNIATLKDRQEAVAHLATRGLFRLKLAIETQRATQQGADLTSFIQWSQALKNQANMPSKWVYLGYIAPYLAIATCIQAVLSIAFEIPTLWQICLVAQLILFMVTTTTLQSHYAPLIQQGHQGLMDLSQAFQVVEKTSFAHPYLQQYQQVWKKNEQFPSQRIAHIGRIADALAVRHSALLYGILSIVFLWEIRYGLQAWHWRMTHGIWVKNDLHTLYDWESLSSLATYTADHSEHQWPTLHTSHDQAVIQTQDMAHPLFDQATRKANDFTLQQRGHLWLITGSNMSGKSSFLRTLGLNAHLAFAGAPVCAHMLSITPLRIASSVQITDDPSQGWSRFYAEVKRIRSVIEASEQAQSSLPVLYLIDEMLSGTNSKERRLASRRIAQRLLQAPHAFGLITTHDLDLAQLIQRYPHAMFAAHFSDRFDGTALHFDYQLKEGVAKTTNALHVLQLEGIYVPEAEDGFEQQDTQDSSD